ncbi:hypothetical protein LCGC14_0521460 [marine sediment metagenome]|uniref:DNA-directed DNA polymerase n=1 Tax=marine sediment metagenome TaxID=412755 RepID=A0A0F9UJU7_9ZZZZ
MNYPDLNNSKIISFDIETYDPELKELGPGVYRRDGDVLGMAIANEQGFSEYYDLGHKGITIETKQKNMTYLKDVLSLPCKKLGTAILYDLDWINSWLNIKVKGELHDIQVAESLIDENQIHYSLDFQANKYLKIGKEWTLIEEFCKRNNLKGDPRNHLYLMRASIVRNYAIGDVKKPLEIFRQQWRIMKKQGLLNLYHLEMELFPLLLQMRQVGVRIDEKAIKQGITKLSLFIKSKSSILWEKYGKFNYNSSQQIAIMLNQLGISYPLTKKGNPNLDKHSLPLIDHSISKEILEIREANKILSTFFINAFTRHNTAGRIHCNFHSMKTEEYGAKSGRFSCSNPNLQQIPSREETFGKLCRSVFIPEQDHTWIKVDYNQIEYRLIAHYAQGKGSENIKKQYNEDPKTDYHEFIMNLTELSRKDAKKLNFGTVYFMGVDTMSREFGWSKNKCESLINAYNREVPFLKTTRRFIIDVAKSRGYLCTLLKRRARITQEMRDFRKEYSMFNRLMQGSAADILKKAMRDAYKAGIFNVLVPHLTVHDELDSSKPKTKEGNEATTELKYIMENCIKLKVPLIADVEEGPNWGETKEFGHDKIYN